MAEFQKEMEIINGERKTLTMSMRSVPYSPGSSSIMCENRPVLASLSEHSLNHYHEAGMNDPARRTPVQSHQSSTLQKMISSSKPP